MYLMEFLRTKLSRSASMSWDSFLPAQYRLTMPALKHRTNFLSMAVWTPSREGPRVKTAPGFRDRRCVASSDVRSRLHRHSSWSLAKGESGGSGWTK